MLILLSDDEKPLFEDIKNKLDPNELSCSFVIKFEAYERLYIPTKNTNSEIWNVRDHVKTWILLKYPEWKFTS